MELKRKRDSSGRQPGHRARLCWLGCIAGSGCKPRALREPASRQRVAVSGAVLPLFPRTPNCLPWG